MRILKRLSLIALFGVTLMPFSQHANAADQTAAVEVVSQEFELVDNTTLSLIVHVTAPAEQLSDGDLKLRLLQRVTDYKTFVDAQNDLSVDAIDQVNFKTASLSKLENGDYMVFVGIDRTGAAKENLNIRESGVYPLAVVFQSGDTRVSSTIFIHARSVFDPAPKPIDTTFVFNVQTKPTLQPDGTIAVSDEAVTQWNGLVTTLSSSRYPMIVGVAPESLEGLAASENTDDQVLVRKTRRLLNSQVLTAQPYVPLDPSAAARAGLGSEFNHQMRLGEDAMSALFTTNQTQRQLWIAEDALDSFGANLIRDNGARTVFLLPSALEAEPDASTYPRTSVQPAALSGGSSLDIASVDPFIAEALSGDSAHPTVNAANAMAHVIVASELASEASESKHQLFVSSTNGSMPEALVLAEFLKLIATSSYVNVTTSLVTSDSGSPYEIPIRSSREITGTASAISDLNAAVLAASSMLPSDAPQRLSWSLTAARAVSNRLSTKERDAYINAVYAEINDLFKNISIPTNASFTLPSRTSEIRLQLRNDSDTDLSVRVRLVSSKLTSQDESQLVVLKAGATTDVPMKVRARTSGRFQIELQVTTPEGNHFIAPPAILRARVTGLAGLGQVVSGALLLLILTWWVAHFRRNRRAALREGTVQ